MESDCIWGRPIEGRPYCVIEAGQIFPTLLEMDADGNKILVPEEARKFFERVLEEEIETIDELIKKTNNYRRVAEIQYFGWLSEKENSLKELIKGDFEKGHCEALKLEN